ncbi:MAG TPA: type VII secretion protein EccB, partial [Pseudonocardia sp.]|nr:type VII secretion protein EccB [Pseudonocardia sp.]
MRAPATRDQADAYRFGLRRLEAALVRADPVPLHEQIRAQRRATLAGVLLGLLGLCAAAAHAALAPRPDWQAQDLVVGAGTGAMYAVAHRPDRLVPVTNLVAARLVLAGLREAGASDADPGRTVPVTVPDEALAGAPRAPAPAVPGAFAADPGRPVAPRWAVCDEVGPDGRIVATTVVGGAIATPPMAPGDGTLLADEDGMTWLVSAGRRHRADLGDDRLVAVYGLSGARPRAVSGALLAVLPEGPGLATPVVTGRGGPAPGGLPGRVGDVLVARPVGGSPRYFVVLSGGLQQVPDLVAELLRMASVARAIRPVPFELVGAVPVVDELPVVGWPAPSPRLLAADQAPLLCWGWADG